MRLFFKLAPYYLLCLGVIAYGAQKQHQCGTERWAVKTSADLDMAKVDMRPVEATVASLNTILAPSRAELDAKPDSRFPSELKVYRVQGYLEGFKLEGDSDFHIVTADLDNPKATMVSEMPSESCVPANLRNESAFLRASWQTRFGKATMKYKDFSKHKIKIEIVGIGFFDFIHGQTGVARNGFELHRVLSWREIH